MSREIKFRAFIAGKMLVVGVHPFLMTRHHGDDGKLMDNEEEGALTVTPNEKTLMQYTGLKDKVGVEIYEGDVIRRIANMRNYSDADGDETTQHMVKWEGIELMPFSETGTHTEEYEIIGNVYQNPELLTHDQD